MQLDVAQKIKQAADKLSLGNNLRLIEDYSSPGTGNEPTAAISTFNFAFFVQSVARAAISVAQDDETVYSEECEEFIDGLDNLRQEDVGFDTVIY